jgi:hypothetical protein
VAAVALAAEARAVSHQGGSSRKGGDIVGRTLLGIAIGVFLAGSTRAAELCLAPSHPGSLNGSVACDAGHTFVDNQWIGFSTSGTPCATSTGCTYGDPPPPLAFCWSISSSAVVPFLNTGVIGPGVTTLYLWLVTGGDYGLVSAEFYLAGDLNVVAVMALNGFVVSHPSSDPREVRILVLGCPNGPAVGAAIQIEGVVSVSPDAWGRVKSLYR